MAAVPQELGTAHMPTRPFLAPVAAGMGEEVARAVGARVAAALRGDSTDGFDPNGIQFASESGEHPEDPEDVPVKKDLELPGHIHTHTPQLIPGLNSPVPTIPLLGGGRGPVSAAPRPAAPSSAASTGQPPARAVPSSPAAPRPSTPGRQEATPAAPGAAAEAARFGRTGAEYETLARDPAQGGKITLKTE